VRFIPSDVDAFIASRRIGAIKKNHRKSKAPLRQAAPWGRKMQTPNLTM